MTVRTGAKAARFAPVVSFISSSSGLAAEQPALGYGCLFDVKLPWVFLAKVTAISVLASLTAHYIAVLLSPLMGILCGGSAALVVLFGLVNVMGVLNPDDSTRFNTLTASLPKRFSGPVNKAVGLLFRPAIAR